MPAQKIVSEHKQKMEKAVEVLHNELEQFGLEEQQRRW